MPSLAVPTPPPDAGTAQPSTSDLAPNRTDGRPSSRRRIRTTGIGLASSAVRWSGLPRLARRSKLDRAGVLVYHDPAPATIERHLEALSAHHSFVTLDALVEALRRRRWNDIPPRSLAVTFDDGHRGNAALADVFASFGVVPTVYVCSGIVGTTTPFWWTLPGIDVARLKHVPNGDRLAALASTGDHSGSRQALTLEELRTLSRTWTLGAHTSSHPVLTRCSDSEAREEIFASQREVTSLTGRPCAHFAFPNGAFGEREVALVREAGFLSARTMVDGWIRDETDPHRLPSIPMPDTGSADRALAQVTIASLAPAVLRRFGSRI